MTRLMVDGVFFQLNSTGIARVWKTILALLAGRDDLEVFLLDRGGVPDIPGVQHVPFQEYSMSQSTAQDSIAIQAVCDRLNIDVFSSSYYTTPLKTPMLLMVYDMIPELFDYELGHRPWLEKQVAISFAQRYLCISEQTREDLLALYPEIPESSTAVAYCGVDVETFYDRPANSVEQFKQQRGLDRPYFLLVGSRGPRGNYKNSALFFDAMAEMHDVNVDVLCIGGEEAIEPEFLDQLPPGVRCRREVVSDEELALAYGGALALIYPSLYEGFGMPVVEAMASGCPVITTNHGSLAEAAGSAALLVEGHSRDEMKSALNHMQSGTVQAELKVKGIEHAKMFSWENMADCFHAQLQELLGEHQDRRYDGFFDDWEALRVAQAAYDTPT